MKQKVIAIDGPSGSGKSTIAKIISQKLNLTYLDTGAMFRAIAYSLKDLSIDFTKDELDKDEIETVSKYLQSLKFEYGVSESILVRLNDNNLTDEIREHYVSDLASRTSKFPIIRNYLKDKQREIANTKPSVLEGRDIGTVIFPGALVKIFLTADSKVRAKRRYDQLVEKDPDTASSLSVKSIQADIESRDALDQSRETAPLKMANDAISIDTSNKSIEEVADEIISEYDKKKELFKA